MRIKWQGKIEERRKELHNLGYTDKKTAEILTQEFGIYCSKCAVESRRKNLVKKAKKIKRSIRNEINIKQLQTNIEQAIKKELSNNTSKLIDNSFESNRLFEDDLYDEFKNYIVTDSIKQNMRDIWEKFNTGKLLKIFNISDLHAPYTNFEKLTRAINENLDCDICVLNGDIFDGESMSKFDKMNELNSKVEFKMVDTILNVLSQKFKYVLWVWGNHDGGRFVKYICKNIKHSLRQYAFEHLNPIANISAKYSNVITINHNTLEIGDIIFKHPNAYSSVELKTVVNENDIIYANRDDLPNPNYRALIIGHTHDVGLYYRNGILLAETGCMCKTPDYRFTNPVKRRWTTGYMRLELDANYKVLFNKCRLINLDE